MSYNFGVRGIKWLRWVQVISFPFFASLLFVLLLAGTVYAQQQITVTGLVTDENGDPLPGATVAIEGTDQGTTSDIDGIYEINVAEDGVLVFSYVGYESHRVAVEGRARIDVNLMMASGLLDEVVVVGYGTQERSQITGSISSISGREIENKPITSLDGHLLGKTSGVRVSQTTGEPGGGMTVNIRGLSSIQAGNEPLYVIDGVPIKSGNAAGLKQGGSLNALADINPNDIESIEILKDASASSIYGSRASGGVVLITTKRGIEGRPQINFSAYTGVQRITQYIEVVNARQRREIFTENWFDRFETGQLRDNITDSLNYMYSGNTHWQDRIFDKAPMYNADLSISGGSQSMTYSLSASLNDQEGIMANTGFRRVTGRSNVEYQAGNFTVGNNLSYSNAQHDMIRQSGGGLGNWGDWTNQPPYQRPIDDQGRVWQREPLINLTGPIQDNIRDRIVANFHIKYQIIENLLFRSNYAIDNMQVRESIFYPSSVHPVGSERRARAYSSRDFGWINENTLTYEGVLMEGHNIEALLGFSQQKDRFESMVAEASQAASDKIPTVNAGPVLENATSQNSSWAMVSYFSRVRYNYDGKYFITGTLRRDGSSKFGKDTRYGSFPSFSAGWRVSEESFIQEVGLISNLMLRVSYGMTGNQEGIGNFTSRGLTATGANYLGKGGIRPVNMPNQLLAWESTAQLDIGFDLSLFKDRLGISFDYFNKQTEDLLFNRELPGSTGYSSVLVNIGKIENRGVEIDLITRNLTGRVSWNTNFNISFNKNKILSLPGGEDVFFGNEVYREGEPIGTFYGYIFDGVYATDEDVPEGPVPGSKLRNQANGPEFKGGDIILRDINNDGVIDSDDRTLLGNAQPNFVGGITNSFQWRGLSLDIFFNFSFGNKRYNSLRQTMDSWGGLYQTPTLYAYENRWQNPGDITDVPVNSRDRNSAVGNNRGGTSRWIEDASYIRLKTITLSYDLPIKITDLASIQRAQIFVNGQNLWTSTKWTGYDPEVGDNLYPLAASVTAGLNINF